MSKKGNVYISKYPDDSPDWYWVTGLHDACITNVEELEFPFDYNKFIRQKNEYDRNALILTIDAKNALFDQKVKEIRLFNYKILDCDEIFKKHKSAWWLGDELYKENEQYLLDIDLCDTDNCAIEYSFKIKFERAEVDR